MLHLYLVEKLKERLDYPGCETNDVFKEILDQMTKALDTKKLPEKVHKKVNETLIVYQKNGPQEMKKMLQKKKCQTLPTQSLDHGVSEFVKNHPSILFRPNERERKQWKQFAFDEETLEEIKINATFPLKNWEKDIDAKANILFYSFVLMNWRLLAKNACLKKVRLQHELKLSSFKGLIINSILLEFWL